MKYLVSLLLILMVGCRSLPQDTTPAPINHNKMTLELHACGKQEVGLNGCFFKDDLTQKLVIPLWASGEYQIKSERCQFFENKRYDVTQKLELTYGELLAQKPNTEDGCLYNIKVFIDGFDNGFEGFFTLANGDIKPIEFNFLNNDYIGYAGIQIKESTVLQEAIKIKAETPGLVFWEGCQKKGELQYKSNPSINFQDIIEGAAIPKASCVLTIGLIPNDMLLPVEYSKIHINIYEKTVSELVQPSFTYIDGKLTVKADKLVAAIAIGDSLKIHKGLNGRSFTKEVSKDEEVDVRISTSNGRFMLLKVKNGEVLWIK